MIIPAGFGQCNLRFVGSGVPSGAEMTFGFENEDDLDPVVVANTIGDIYDDSNMRNNFATDCSLSSILVKLGPNVDGPSAEVSHLVPGTIAASGTTPQVALLITKMTAIGGRKGRGRFYQPGLAEASVTQDGVIDPDYLAGAQSQYTDFLARLAGGALRMVLLHGSADDAPNGVGFLTVQSLVATQRRRLRR